MHTEIINSIHSIFNERFNTVGTGVRNEQEQVIVSVLSGRNTLSLMPTGGGKSLCFWIAGLALGGTTLAIFPLTALMDEQALKLRSHGLNVLTLHSGMSPDKQYRELTALAQGKLPDFIFVSPERLATDGFVEYVLHRQRDHLKLVVIDEIHCVSQWGHDFRPFYREIPHFLDQIFGSTAQWPALLGMTATISEKDIKQACDDFHIAPQNVLKSRYLLRYAIDLQVENVTDENEKDVIFWTHLDRHRNEKMLVYLDNRSTGPRSTEGMCDQAVSQGYAAAHFHAGMTSEAKADVIQRFKDGIIRLVFATSAFGMGIDIPDIRGVIHYRPPESVEQYYQQVGRVGRDGEAAWAKLYYSDKNLSIRKSHFIDRSFPSEKNIRDAFATLTSGSGNIQTVAYFEDETIQSAFHYLLDAGAIHRQCKGIRNIKIFSKMPNVSLPKLAIYQEATRTGIIIRVSKDLNIPPCIILQDLYNWLANGKLRIDRSPEKCLIIEQLVDELSDKTMTAMLTSVEEKKQYRYGLLNQFSAILEDYTNSINLHQEIGRYLNVDKFQLGLIHETVSGIWVRSKSEVIIANLLTSHHIPFAYEQRLEAEGVGFSPDFTLEIDGKIYFWEHLGMLDLAQYRQNWEIKHEWYKKYFPNQLLTTNESSVLSQTVERIIREKLGGGTVSGRATERRLEAPRLDEEDVEPEDTHNTLPSDPVLSATIWTEGQTDWKHMKAAFTRLQKEGHFQNLHLDFQEDESDMGYAELQTQCRAYSRKHQSPPVLCIFDRDVTNIMRQITDNGKNYKSWGNNVFSVALPVPEHRQKTPDISIEFYYSDKDIHAKDDHGRRLYIGTEFSARTFRHQKENLVCADQSKAGRFTIVDSRVHGDTDENVALSKNNFANNVLGHVPHFDKFDISAFVPLFQMIEQLLMNENNS